MTKYLTSALVCTILMMFVSIFNIWACAYMAAHKNLLWIAFMFYAIWGIMLIVKFFNCWKKQVKQQKAKKDWDEFENAWKIEMKKEQEKWKW